MSLKMKTLEIPQVSLHDKEDDSDNFSEVDEVDLHVGNTDTLLDEILDESDQMTDKEYVFSPGEGQRPISFL